MLTGIELKSSQSYDESNLGNTVSWTIDVQNTGIRYVGLEFKITPVGSGTQTLTKLAPFGIIKTLTVSDQAGNVFGIYKGYELAMLHYALAKNNPFQNCQYDDSTDGYLEIPDATTAASGNPIVGFLHLPITIGKDYNCSRIKFDLQFNAKNSTTGILGFSDFSTSFTSVAIVLTPSVFYDDAIVETWFSHDYDLSSVSTTTAEFSSPPVGAKIRYAFAYLLAYWDAQNATTENENEMQTFEFWSDTTHNLIKMDLMSMRYNLQELLQADPEFILGNTTATAFNWTIVSLPDTVMGINARFKISNIAAFDSHLKLIEIVSDPGKANQSKARAPAVLKSILSG